MEGAYNGIQQQFQLFSRGYNFYFLPKLTAMLLVIFDLNRSLRGASAQYIAYCSTYCDVYDNLILGAYCESLYHPVYCCGTVYNKTCCGDVLYKVEDTADETVCGHAWLYYQWSLIYGLVAVLMVVLMVIICCICCRGYHIISRRNRASEGRQDRGERGEEPDAQSLGFDPACEYAFEPPRYETLPKDPPKYNEVFTTITMEHANAAFVSDEQPVAPLTTTTTTTTTSSPATTTMAAVTERELPVFSPSDVTAQSPVLCSDSSTTSGPVEADGRCQAEMVVVAVDDNGSELSQSSSASSYSSSSSS